MRRIEHALACFRPTKLEELNAVNLLRRYDTKFVFHRDKIVAIFDALSGDYKILEIGNNRSFTYETLYYDTDDYLFYHQHHNRKLNRYKIRCRRYRESNQCYFEVKLKNNRRETIKSRLPLGNGAFDSNLSEESKLFAKERMLSGDGWIVEKVTPKLKVFYNRITLANHTNKERLTFDTDLTYIDRRGALHRINNVTIAELKSEQISLNSRLYQHLKGLGILPAKFSKYCMGIAVTEQNVKCNRFKKKIMGLKKFS